MSSWSSNWYPARAASPWDAAGRRAVELYLASPAGVTVEVTEAYRRAMLVRRPLLWVAATHTAGAALAMLALYPSLVAHDARAELASAALVGVAAAFWAVWGWAAVAPLPAAVVGLTMYASLSYLAYAAAPAWPAAYNTAEWAGRLGAGATAAAFVVSQLALLVRAVAAGTCARRAADPHVPATGLFPVLALYAALLAIVALPRVIASQRFVEADDVLHVMALMAAVVIVAAVIGRRSVWPAVADAGGSWLVVGVLLGLGTFAFASIYGDAVAAAFGLPRVIGQTDVFAEAGYGWAGSVLGVVIFPAVFEELAFRGLIVPRLARVMSGGETAVVSAAMFAVLHLDATRVPFLLPMGIALAWLRRRSGSLWPCVLMHLVHNGAVMIAGRI